jgi:DtxR family Mn-dependent transcriptional regulator
VKTHTESEENYIKALYHLGGDNPVSNGDLAQRVGAKGSSVTQAVKRLSQKNLVTVVPYKGVQLTEDGVLLAKSILRKHRLWETFLVDTLGFGWDQVHPLAEQLEHVQSEELVERLSEFLGAPKHDPHGDPIPQPNGQMPPVLGEPLGAFAKGHTIKVVRVEDAGSEFFDQLDAMNINLGNTYDVEAISSFDASVQLKAPSGHTIWLSHSMCANIYAVSA